MLESLRSRAHARLTRVQALPVLSRFVPAPNVVPSSSQRAGFLKCQRLAQESVRTIAGLIQPGWTEVQAAEMIETFLRDSGVRNFFHKPYAWFGDRTRFEGISGYRAFMPTQRVLREGEPFLLDVAPILGGFIADIGYSDCLSDSPKFRDSVDYLSDLRSRIPAYFERSLSGGEICREIEADIESHGYENRHRKYPFSVLGHRVHRVSTSAIDLNVLNFGWQSFWALLSRGLLGQLFNQHTSGDLVGLWALEPHIGRPGTTNEAGFGAKFEEILVVEPGRAYWLEGEGCFCKKRS